MHRLLTFLWITTLSFSNLAFSQEGQLASSENQANSEFSFLAVRASIKAIVDGVLNNHIRKIQ